MSSANRATRVIGGEEVELKLKSGLDGVATEMFNKGCFDDLSHIVIPWDADNNADALASDFAVLQKLSKAARALKPTDGDGDDAGAQAVIEQAKQASLKSKILRDRISRVEAKDVRSALSEGKVDELAADALLAVGVLGVRRYAVGQKVAVRIDPDKKLWVDAEVVGPNNRLRIEGEEDAEMLLHPWNHAPRDLIISDFDIVKEHYANKMRDTHHYIIDALSGRQLDVMKQLVAIEVSGGSSELAGIQKADDLTDWLHISHDERCEGKQTGVPTSCALLTGPPAAGKSSLLSQILVLSLDKEAAELVPILIRVQAVQLELQEEAEAYTTSWNWIDTHLRLMHEKEKDGLIIYRMLRQAMMARRALILLDGLDEGGTSREEIETHVATVLAPQGHTILATSRPTGLSENQFRDFQRLNLKPLTEQQQLTALQQRMGEQRAAALGVFLKEHLQVDDSGHKLTSNPLMLSMVASVFELRQGLEMPDTVVGLYKVAITAMLARQGDSASKDDT
eukprot:5960248-Prymnesium_polylepis.1